MVVALLVKASSRGIHNIMKGFDNEGDYPLGDIRLNFFLVLPVRASCEGEVVLMD